MVKFSELDMKDKLYVEGKYVDAVMTKKEILEDLDYIKEQTKGIYTTYEYSASIDAKWVIESAIEDESGNMYEDWETQALKMIDKKDIEDVQKVLDRILKRTNRISYSPSDKVEIDL